MWNELTVKRVWDAIRAAAAVAERVRPRPLVSLGALIVISIVLDQFAVKNSVVVRIVFGLLVGGLYLFPWLVSIVREFFAGYRANDDPE